MKAWIVGRKEEFYSTVVFAETRGKARALALHTDCCEDSDFCDIEVRRYKKADGCYKEGKKEMDWWDDKDRTFLVKECGFRCEYVEEWVCDKCPAKEYCELYQDYIEVQNEVT